MKAMVERLSRSASRRCSSRPEPTTSHTGVCLSVRLSGVAFTASYCSGSRCLTFNSMFSRHFISAKRDDVLTSVCSGRLLLTEMQSL